MRAIIRIGKKANRIKKESPNEGTETSLNFGNIKLPHFLHKKRIPE